ncbi:sialidase family protein [Draconibacterium sp. IB214405]|uniref:sialidase family protein n=1 Tax=Draconibacterium sp. IB214405 TaxID=3097352 RepID=UPI002A169587|nr:sialidase family protein [Draconibacterium sp. IB214405]MDX8340483.1 sialidase family protein [Draconibacterium sp. IB214405]
MKNLFILFCLAFIVFTACRQENNTNFALVSESYISDTLQYAQCHASTIIETKNGLLLSFFGGQYERHPQVSIYTAAFENGQWQKPQKVADGKIDTTYFPTWNPVLFRNTNEQIDLFYKIGPSPNDWWGMVEHSNDEGKTWSAPEKLPNGILGPIRNKPIQLNSGVILSPSSIEESHELWKAHIERSTDNGQTWTKITIPSPDSVKVIQPTLLVYPDESIQALLRSNQNVVMESWSHDEGKSWSEVQPTTIPHPNSGIDAITLQSGAKLLVNNPLPGGNSWEAGRNKLDLYYSADGKIWNTIMHLEDEPEGEFSYPCIIQTTDGLIHITYTYNRRQIKHVVLSAVN